MSAFRHLFANCSVDGEGCGDRVRFVVPASVEAGSCVGPAGRNRPVVAQVRHGHVSAALRLVSVPELRHRAALT